MIQNTEQLRWKEEMIKKAIAFAKKKSYELNVDSYTLALEDAIEYWKQAPVEQELKEGEITTLARKLWDKWALVRENHTYLTSDLFLLSLQDDILKEHLTRKTNSKEGEWEKKFEEEMPCFRNSIGIDVTPTIINWIKDNKELIK